MFLRKLWKLSFSSLRWASCWRILLFSFLWWLRWRLSSSKIRSSSMLIFLLMSALLASNSFSKVSLSWRSTLTSCWQVFTLAFALFSYFCVTDCLPLRWLASALTMSSPQHRSTRNLYNLYNWPPFINLPSTQISISRPHIDPPPLQQGPQQLQLALLAAMKQEQPARPQPYSLLTSMYLSWEEYKIPAVYYHYLLAILPKLPKNHQVLLMTREVKSLKANTHPYHKIVNAIEARQKSLQIIRGNVHTFVQYQSTDQMDWPNSLVNKSNHIELQFDNYSPKHTAKSPNSIKYQAVHEDPLSPILTPPRLESKQKQTRLQELLNHIRLYQRVTVQIVTMIASWEEELRELGYADSIIQFQYRKEDYLQTVNRDVADLVKQYSEVFENNPFLLMKKVHEKTQLVLIYQDLKLSDDMVNKIYYCLNLIANHEAEILRFRMLAKVSQTANRKRTITKSTDVSKIYMNYNHGQHYLLIKDSETMKKSKILHEPPLSKNNKINDELYSESHNLQAQNGKLQGIKNSILINPQTRLMTIDRTVRKHPVKSNLINLLSNNQSKDKNFYLKSPQESQQAVVGNSQVSLKRSQTEDIFKKRSASMMLLDQANSQNKPFKANMSGSKFREKVQVKPINGKNTIIVGDAGDDIESNKRLSTQRKLQLIDKLNSVPKLKNVSHAEQSQIQKEATMNQPAFAQVEAEVEEKKQEKPGQLSESNKITLIFEENIKQTQVVKYLRQRVFQNSPEVGFEEIQSLGKKLLAEKNFITFIRVQCNKLNVAWLAVKFMEKDNTMRRSVLIVYVRKFVRLSGFERKLLDNFVEHGYGLIRNEQKILFEIQLLDVVMRPVIKVKYKVNPTVEKEELKQIMKKQRSLAQSRILKYYSYSKTSKYHAFCQHEKSHCQISYNFIEISKICVEKNHYIKAKADRISKLGQDLYRVSCVVNQTDLIISNNLTDILNLEKETQIEKDSSFDSKYENKYKYIGVREGKVMRKFVNEANQPVICEFVTVIGAIPQVKSIAFTKEEVQDDVLLLNPPYYMAFMTRDVGEQKTLAILEFS